jgi:hypothetical protein
MHRKAHGSVLELCVSQQFKCEVQGRCDIADCKILFAFVLPCERSPSVASSDAETVCVCVCVCASPADSFRVRTYE